jgi:hypothetical protein
VFPPVVLKTPKRMVKLPAGPGITAIAQSGPEPTSVLVLETCW